MAVVKSKDAARIDELMDRASEQLVARQYFDAEVACADALQRAYAIGDYERMARILLPLQECRRQKRDLARDARAVFRVAGEMPSGRALKRGCYLVEPPRVGLDGRLLREEADRRKIPVIVVVREPTTRAGLWPVVAIGPVTIRTRVPQPDPATSKPRRSRRIGAPGADPLQGLPDPDWFLRACETIGDSAMAQIADESVPSVRVQALFDRLQSHPDHEKLHQGLEAACRDAARIALAPPKIRRPRPIEQLVKEDEDDDF